MYLPIYNHKRECAGMPIHESKRAGVAGYKYKFIFLFYILCVLHFLFLSL